MSEERSSATEMGPSDLANAQEVSSVASWYAAILKSPIGRQLRSFGFTGSGTTFQRNVADGIIQFISFRYSTAGASLYKALYCEWAVTAEQFLLFREFESGRAVDRRRLASIDYMIQVVAGPPVGSPWRDAIEGSSAWIWRFGSIEELGLGICEKIQHDVVPKLEGIFDRNSLLEQSIWPPPPDTMRWVHPALAAVALSIGTASSEELDERIAAFIDWAHGRKISTGVIEKFIAWLRKQAPCP